MILLLLCSTILPLRSQDRASALSDAEVETLRELAPEAPKRIGAFIGFVDVRADSIEKLASGPRKPGREEDLHELMVQITAILEDLDDNLDEYGKHHNDVRRVLPKLVAATERWSTVIRSPAENEEYSVQRKLALESLHDVHDVANAMIAEQSAWFKSHPPGKSDSKKGSG